MKSDNLSLKLGVIRPSQSGEQGSATVISLGIGLALTMIGIMMMTRSQGDVSTISGQIAIAKSLDASETGIVRIQTFIDRYRAIATYSACGDSSLLTTGTCTDTTNPSWFNPSAIPNLSSSSYTQVSSAATQNWQNIDPATANKEEYRLIDYTYSSGVATLTIDGRVDRGIGRGPSTTRLVITIPINRTTGPSPIAGLWAQNFNFSNTKAQVAGNVLDSSDYGSGGKTFPTSYLRNLPQQPIPSTAPYPLSTTPSIVTTQAIPFPPLPGNTYTGQLATIPTDNVNNKSCINSSAKVDVIYPQPGDIFTDASGTTNLGTYNSGDLSTAPSGSGTYTYHFDASCGGKSIAFSSSGGLQLGNSTNQTMKIFLDGQLATTNTGGVHGYTDTSGNSTTVIMYSNSDIFITNSGSITAPESLQIYNYGVHKISLTNTGDIRGFIFAPQSTVSLTNTGSMIGAVWTQTFTSSNSGSVYQSIMDTSKLQISLGGGENTLGNISSWTHQPVN